MTVGLLNAIVNDNNNTALAISMRGFQRVDLTEGERARDDLWQNEIITHLRKSSEGIFYLLSLKLLLYKNK
jgi:hypothetical protein